MFMDCASLTSLDLPSFNTINVINMNNLFSGCIKLQSLNISSFNTQNVNQMDYMLYGIGLVYLDISKAFLKLSLSNFFLINL